MIAEEKRLDLFDSIFGISSECEKYSNLIIKYAEQEEFGDGTLTNNEIQEIKLHIEKCRHCSSMYKKNIEDIRDIPTFQEELSIRNTIFLADMGVNFKKAVHIARKVVSKVGDVLPEIPFENQLTSAFIAGGGIAIKSNELLDLTMSFSPEFASVRGVADTINKDSFKGESRGYYEVTRSGTKDERTFKLRASYNARGQVLIIWRNPDGSCRLFSPLKYEEGEKSFTHWDGNVFIFSGVVSTDEQLGEHLIFISILPENTLEPVDNKLSDEAHTLKAKEILENLPEDSEDTIIYLNVTD